MALYAPNSLGSHLLFAGEAPRYWNQTEYDTQNWSDQSQSDSLAAACLGRVFRAFALPGSTFLFENHLSLNSACTINVPRYFVLLEIRCRSWSTLHVQVMLYCMSAQPCLVTIWRTNTLLRIYVSRSQSLMESRLLVWPFIRSGKYRKVDLYVIYVWFYCLATEFTHEVFVSNRKRSSYRPSLPAPRHIPMFWTLWSLPIKPPAKTRGTSGCGKRVDLQKKYEDQTVFTFDFHLKQLVSSQGSKYLYVCHRGSASPRWEWNF